MDEVQVGQRLAQGVLRLQPEYDLAERAFATTLAVGKEVIGSMLLAFSPCCFTGATRGHRYQW
jgi:hypothetical protein